MRRLSGIAAAFLTVFSGVTLAAGAVITDESPLPQLKQLEQHYVVSQRIKATLTRAHYLPVRFDDALSTKVYDEYLQGLDYYRNVLLKSDVDNFEKYRLQFDDAINQGQFDFAYQMFQLALQRRSERFDYALKLLEKDFDFTTNDSYEFEREDAPWPADQKALDELWRQRVKFDALNLKLAGKNNKQIRELLVKRYKNAKKRLAQTESEDVFSMVMNAYAHTIEAHTYYLSPRNADRFQQDMNLTLEGIGAVLQADDDYTVISSLVPGGPADMSKKLKPKDRIVGVAQGADEFVDVVGWRLDDVVDLIKGPKGSKVRLQVLGGSDNAGTVPQQIELTRDKVRLEDRAAKGEVFHSLLYKNDKKVGVISINGFYNNLTDDVLKELNKLKAEKIDALIIDLRGNGGGSLPEAISLSGLFFEQGPVVQIREGNGRISQNDDPDPSVAYTGPMTVLVDRFSASASEIFAAAMQDYGRAVILGEDTFGKGTVQANKSLKRFSDPYQEDLGDFNYTIAKFYRVNGGSTQHKGVIPDIKFPTPIDPEEWGESKEKTAMPWDSIEPAVYQASTQLKALLPELTKNYQQRIAVEPEFKYLAEDIAAYKKEQAEKRVSLNEKTRLAEQDAENAKALKRVNERLQRLGKPAVKKVEDAQEALEKLDPLLEEAVLITKDLAAKTTK